MADPVSALAVAGTVANILQIIDFSVKVLYNASKIMANNSPREAISFAQLGRNYAEVSEQMLNSMNRPRPPTAREANMDKIAEECSREVGELLDLLNDLRIDEGTRGLKRAAQATKAGIKSVTKRKAIEEKQQNVERLNGMLGTVMMETLRETQIAFQEELTEQMTRDTHSVLLAVQAAVTDINGEANRQQAKSARIVRSLRFKDTLRRRNEIPPAYCDTYEWMFDRKKTGFRDWLENGDGIFWISGVAGSGKSTVMKYLYQHPETMRLTKMWAGEECHAVCAEFYFWYLGSSLQKSVLGLLQSILYQIFKSCPDLVREACPERWESDALGLGETDPWVEEELLEALNVVARSTSHTWVGEPLKRKKLPVRFTFFIDGLDEYDGNHRELVTLIKTLSETNHIRMCVSSRPWNDFSNRFDVEGRALRLENLTRGDITTYVKGELNKAVRVKASRNARLKSSKLDCTSLVETVVERSNGVFLWVFLVVRSLRDGFENGDSIAVMQQRVEKLPTELVGYFRLMLDRLDGTYAKLTAQALFMAALPHRGPEVLLGELSFVDLWLLHERPDHFESELFAVQAPILDYSMAELADMLFQMTIQIRAWCRDFLHVPDLTAVITKCHSGIDYIQNGKIQFLHRTVHDFLSLDDVQNVLRKHVPEHFHRPDFPKKLALARLKTVPTPGDGMRKNTLRDYFLSSSTAILNAIDFSNGSEEELCYDLDCVGEHYLRCCGPIELPRGAKAKHDPSRSHLAFMKFVESGLLNTPHAYLAQLEQQSCQDTATDEARAAAHKTKVTISTAMLSRALQVHEPVGLDVYNPDLGLVQDALEAGADMDATPIMSTTQDSQLTIWQSFLQRAISQDSATACSQNLLQVAELLMEHGADPDVRCMAVNFDKDNRPKAINGRQTQGGSIKLLDALVSISPEDDRERLRCLVAKHSSLSWRARLLAAREGPICCP